MITRFDLQTTGLPGQMYAPGLGGHFVAQGGGAAAFGQIGPRSGFMPQQQMGGPQMRVAPAQVPRWNQMPAMQPYGGLSPIVPLMSDSFQAAAMAAVATRR